MHVTPFDTIKPVAPVLYEATVLPDQTIKLSWKWDTASDVKYFEIWRSAYQTHGASVLIDTVVYDSVYVDNGVNLKANQYSYHIIAIDSCNAINRSLPSRQDAAMSLKLYSLYCTKQVQARWTPYNGTALSSYEIYRSSDGITYTGIGTVKANDTIFNDTAGLPSGDKYYYKMREPSLRQWTLSNSYSDTVGHCPKHHFPLADSAQLVYATCAQKR